MIDLLTPDSLASSVRLLRDTHEGAILLIEGPSDAKVLGAFVLQTNCEVVCAFGKDNVIQVTRILTREGILGVLGVIDADFSRLDGTCPDDSNLFLTDAHDLEGMILSSPALDRVLTEFGSSQKILLYLSRERVTIRSELLRVTLPLGYLRWVSLQNGLALRFEEVDFARFIDDRPRLQVHVGRLISTIKNHSQRLDIPSSSLDDQISALSSPDHDPYQVCCGHDLVCVLALSLRRLLGSNHASAVSSQRIHQSLRLAYEFSSFSRTDLYSSIAAWQLSTGYSVFPVQ